MAFIPGYVTQVASGFLFGYPKGAVYGVIGMLLGGVIAVGLARAARTALGGAHGG